MPALCIFSHTPDGRLAAGLWYGSGQLFGNASIMLTLAMQEVAVFLDALDGVVQKQSWGEIAWFHNPGARLASGVYVATIKLRDGPNDRASNLDGDGVHRLNFSMERAEFIRRFGDPPVRPARGQAIIGPWDLQARATLMPHPVYGWMCWAAITDPKPEDILVLKSLLASAHRRARRLHARRINRKGEPLPADTPI